MLSPRGGRAGTEVSRPESSAPETITFSGGDDTSDVVLAPKIEAHRSVGDHQRGVTLCKRCFSIRAALLGNLANSQTFGGVGEDKSGDPSSQGEKP